MLNTQRLSNGVEVGDWIRRNRNNLTNEQLRQLGLHRLIRLTIEQVFEELLEMRNQGLCIGYNSREKLSNGVEVGDWIRRNRNNLTNEQLRQLGLHRLIRLTTEQVFEELLEIQRRYL